MSDYTVNDSMAKIIYEVSDREIYNDVRAEIGITNSETIVDADPLYEWKYFGKTTTIGVQMGDTVFDTFGATSGNALSWQIKPGYFAWFYDSLYNRYDYYDYSIWIESHTASKCVVGHKNTGVWSSAAIQYFVGYRYLISEGSSHEEITYSTLTVRATDETSIKKYGRRVMNLTWPQGTGHNEMQGIADAALARYKDPIPVLKITIQGKTDAIATQIFTREISDIISVVCANLGMASTDFFLDSISIRDTAVRIPVCNWLLTGKRSAETTDYFKFGSGHFGGPEVFG